MSIEYLVGQTGEKLKKGLERHAYLHQEVILTTRHPVNTQTRLSNTNNALVHFLSTSAEDMTYSAGTSQMITLNSSLGYYVVITDPTFSVASGNPETIPRTLVTIPARGGSLQIYLKARSESCSLTTDSVSS